MIMMMTVERTTTITMRRLFGYHYHNPVIIAIAIMTLAVCRKLPPVVSGHAYRWRNSAYDVIEEDDFEGSTDSAYRMTSYDDDDDLDSTFDLSYMTRCQSHKRSERTFNVSCLDDGSYDPTQCHAETKECWCVDDNGDYIQDSIRKLPERPKCQEKVRPTFTLTLVTPSSQPTTTSVENQPANRHQLGRSDPLPSEDEIAFTNQPANQSRNKQGDGHDSNPDNRDDDDDDDDDDEDNDSNHNRGSVSNHRGDASNRNGGMRKNDIHKDDDDDDDIDDDDDDDDDDEGGGVDNGDEDEDEHGADDDDDDDDDDDVTQKDSNKLLRRDPVYTTGLILVVLLSSSIIIIMAILFIHRLKRKDEGSYTLASNAVISTIGYSVTKDTEYFA